MVDWRAIGAIASVGMFVIAALTVFGLAQMQENIPSPGFYLETTDTEQIKNAGWKGRGTFAGKEGTNEVFSRSEYILSHRSNGRSQDIVMQGQITKVGLFPCPIAQVEYILYLSKNGRDYTKWETHQSLALSGTDTVSFEAKQTNVIGYKAEGAIKVEFKGLCIGGTWVHLAKDWAYLRTSVGDINADKQAAVGETITVTWQIPYITADGGAGASKTGETGFYLIGNHLDTGKEIVNKKLTSLQGNFKYTVTSDDYVASSSGDCADNIIRWRLLNELWNIDWQDTTTIDVAGAGPVVNALKWDKSIYKVGNSATLTWEIELGPEGYPIESQKVIWGFGEPTTETTLNGSERSYTTEGLGQAGELHGEVIAYDSACRPSATADTYADVQDPNNPPTPPPGENGSIVWLFALTFAILLSILIIYFLRQIIPEIGGWIDYIIIAIIWLAIAIPLYYGLLMLFEALEALI